MNAKPAGAGGSPKTLRLILGDQLNPGHSWFRTVDPRVSYLLMEVRQETDYVRHHIQKVLAFFQAMRAFRDRLRSRGHRVLYLTLDDPRNRTSIPENLSRLLREEASNASRSSSPTNTGWTGSWRGSTHRRTCPSGPWTASTRHMRLRHDVLMENGKPAGGRWNYDDENRGRLTETAADRVPEPLSFHHDVTGLQRMVRRALPGWYWSGRTRMNCLAQAIGQSLRGAYAHHIQRLMPTGAFALMAGVHPDEVDG